MKKMSLVAAAITCIALAACNPTPKKDCIRCTGCFSTTDICEDTYEPSRTNPMTWEDYKNYMLSNQGNMTMWCERIPD